MQYTMYATFVFILNEYMQRIGMEWEIMHRETLF